jgi:hypothetical protein
MHYSMIHVQKILDHLFPMHIYNEDEVTVNVYEQFLEIYLRACSICPNETDELISLQLILWLNMNIIKYKTQNIFIDNVQSL